MCYDEMSILSCARLKATRWPVTTKAHGFGTKGESEAQTQLLSQETTIKTRPVGGGGETSSDS